MPFSILKKAAITSPRKPSVSVTALAPATESPPRRSRGCAVVRPCWPSACPGPVAASVMRRRTPAGRPSRRSSILRLAQKAMMSRRKARRPLSQPARRAASNSIVCIEGLFAISRLRASRGGRELDSLQSPERESVRESDEPETSRRATFSSRPGLSDFTSIFIFRPSSPSKELPFAGCSTILSLSDVSGENLWAPPIVRCRSRNGDNRLARPPSKNRPGRCLT